MAKIKVGIIGVGNCASGFIQGIEWYKSSGEERAGLMHERVGGYSVDDIVFASAFDIGANKVGKPLSDAIYSGPNAV